MWKILERNSFMKKNKYSKRELQDQLDQFNELFYTAMDMYLKDHIDELVLREKYKDDFVEAISDEFPNHGSSSFFAQCLLDGYYMITPECVKVFEKVYDDATKRLGVQLEELKGSEHLAQEFAK